LIIEAKPFKRFNYGLVHNYREAFGTSPKGPEKPPHSVPKGPLGLVQGKVFSGKIIMALPQSRALYI
jgi:hypothetical protein